MSNETLANVSSLFRTVSLHIAPNLWRHGRETLDACDWRTAADGTIIRAAFVL